MILCDIGNTSAHIWNNGRTNTINIEKFGNFKIKDTLYYINVNDRVHMPEVCKNLEKLLNFKILNPASKINLLIKINIAKIFYAIDDFCVIFHLFLY